MSALKKLLKVRKVQETERLMELSQVHQVISSEEEKLEYLTGFLSEYTIKKNLEGKPIKPCELLNQNRFVGTIVQAEIQQQDKLGKLSKIAIERREEFKSAKSSTRVVSNKVAEIDKASSLENQKKEDDENAELFNYRGAL